jgi:hypothetical protein
MAPGSMIRRLAGGTELTQLSRHHETMNYRRGWRGHAVCAYSQEIQEHREQKKTGTNPVFLLIMLPNGASL